MKTRIKSLLFAFALLLATLCLMACNTSNPDIPDENTQQLEFYPLSDGTYAVSAGKAKFLEQIDIPANYGGKTVTAIAPDAFLGCKNLVSITIPNTITEIGSNAFAACENLSELQIPDSVKEIGESAFYHCTNLTSVSLGSGVAALGERAFAHCKSLSIITVDADNTTFKSVGHCLISSQYKTLVVGCKDSIIPSDGSVTTIGKAAFYGCTELKNIGIPIQIMKIEDAAFSNCSNLATVSYGGDAYTWDLIEIDISNFELLEAELNYTQN